MSYEYDAFFSYKRDRESDQWHEVVKNKLEFWLSPSLPKIFLPGRFWRQIGSACAVTS